MVFFFITSGVFPAGQTNVDPTIGLAMYEVTSGFSHGSRVNGKGMKDKMGCNVRCAPAGVTIITNSAHIRTFCVVPLS